MDPLGPVNSLVTAAVWVLLPLTGLVAAYVWCALTDPHRRRKDTR
ncbi:MAG TPA: hypothetical protein VFJ19_09200 [Nocardioidaceae bacterium]|nr:hypothetical protein [Nocardioidaceae bacterium]